MPRSIGRASSASSAAPPPMRTRFVGPGPQGEPPGAVAWPVEYRSVSADDAWLSPAHGRDTVTLSLHQGAELPWQDFFADLEPLLVAHGGRPHWGKRHGLRAKELEPLYPRFADFRRLRAELDPRGRFLNEHLRAVLG